MTTKPNLHDAKRVVVKVGSLLLIDSANQLLRQNWLHTLAQDIASLRKKQIDVIIVSSGAIAFGRSVLNADQRELKLEEKQAAAACGQIKLMQAWQSAFEAHQTEVAQILLTTEDTENRRRYLNARNTIETLLEHHIIPVINENDSIATAEIRYGDNDRLAARVAGMASADQLILLSDIDGFYTADPKLDANAKRLDVIESISPEIEHMAGDSLEHLSTGGMKTKLAAARMAISAGCHMAIASGKENHPLQTLQVGISGSWFLARKTPLNARRHWISHGVQTKGAIVIDDGAEKALKQGKSLLPAGVVRVKGHFDRGDSITILNANNMEIGRGLSAYASIEAEKLIGKRSDEIEAILGYKGRDALIHRNDMVLA